MNLFSGSMSFMPSLLFLFSWLYCVQSLYFYLGNYKGQTSQQCFREDIPADMIIHGEYKVERYDVISSLYKTVSMNDTVGLLVTITGPDGRQILSRVYKADGLFTFTSVVSGIHYVCMKCIASPPNEVHKMKVHLNMYKRFHDGSSTEKMSKLDNFISQLVGKVDYIQKEQHYQKIRERRFRQTSESTNARVVCWAVVQLFTALFIGVWQMYHLRRFFMLKKIV